MTDLPEVKLKALVNFPANVVGRTGITVVKSSPNYFLDLDYTGFQITPTVAAPDIPNSYNLIWDEAKHTFAKVPFALQTTAGIARVITAAGDVTVAATDVLIILKKTVAADTNFILPPDIDKIGSVKIVDWNGIADAHTLSIVPNGTEKINGQSSWPILGEFSSVVVSPIGTGLGYAA